MSIVTCDAGLQYVHNLPGSSVLVPFLAVTAGVLNNEFVFDEHVFAHLTWHSVSLLRRFNDVVVYSGDLPELGEPLFVHRGDSIALAQVPLVVASSDGIWDILDTMV